MDIINKINKEIGGSTKDGILNNIFEYYNHRIYMKKNIEIKVNGKNYLKVITKFKIKNGKIYKIEERVPLFLINGFFRKNK